MNKKIFSGKTQHCSSKIRSLQEYFAGFKKFRMFVLNYLKKGVQKPLKTGYNKKAIVVRNFKKKISIRKEDY
jgi:hypothetical protein